MQSLRPPPGTSLARGCSIAFGVIWLGFSCTFACPMLITGIAGLAEAAKNEYSSSSLTAAAMPLLMALFIVPVALVGVAVIGWGLWPYIAQMRVSRPEVTISNKTLRVGEDFTINYQQVFKQASDVKGAAFQLVLRESATYRRGTDTVTVTHDKIAQQFDLMGRRYEAGETLAVQRAFRIPDDAMHSFSAYHNRLRWLIKIQVNLAGWADFNEEYEIVVVPERVR